MIMRMSLIVVVSPFCVWVGLCGVGGLGKKSPKDRNGLRGLEGILGQHEKEYAWRQFVNLKAGCQ